MKKEKAKKIHLIVLNCLLVIALVCGIVGQLIGKETVSNAIFRTLMMFVLGFFWDPQNVLVDIARYLAAIFSFSAVATIVFSAFQILLDRYRATKKGSTFVYGDNENAKVFLEYNKKAIHGINGFVDADNYVLLDEEEKNLKFLLDHREELKGKHIYLQTENIPGFLFNENNLRAFSPEELAGRRFWERYDLIRQAYDEEGNPRKLTVSLIGWGKLGEQILFYGLMANSFADVTYHIFGNSELFEKLHADHLEDLQIKAYETDWYDHIDVIKKSDLIIIAEQNNQIKLISNLFLVSAELRVVVCAAFRGDVENKQMLLHNRAGTIPEENLTFYNWRRAAQSLESLIQEEKLLEADLEKEQYSQKKLRKKIQQDWEMLDTFKRYAYINLLDLRRVYEKLKETWGDLVNEEELLRILHTRVLHYYWFHNWNYSPLPDPEHPEQDENVTKRLQRRLRPLEDLTEEEKELELRIVKDVLGSLN